MIADVFSAFDYGGQFRFNFFIGWISAPVLYIIILGVDNTVGVTRLTILINYASEVTEYKNKDTTRVFQGHRIFIVAVFVYVIGGGFWSIFPYNFNVIRHIRHDLCISVPIWLVVILISISGDRKSYFTIIVAEGIPWWAALLISILEFISFIRRPITLGLRFALNIICGKVILCIGCRFLVKWFLIGGLSRALCSALILALLATWESLVVIIQGFIFYRLYVNYIHELFAGRLKRYGRNK